MPRSKWYAHPGFSALYRWRGFLASGCGVVGAAWLWGHSPGNALWSLGPLLGGLALRVWARRHIGLHTRGRALQAPYRAAGGPYRWIAHPLYLANILVAFGCLGALGSSWARTLLASLPVAGLYVVLGLGESAFLKAGDPPSRSVPESHSGWAKEFWSLVPPLALWGVLRMLRS